MARARARARARRFSRLPNFAGGNAKVRWSLSSSIASFTVLELPANYLKLSGLLKTKYWKHLYVAVYILKGQAWTRTSCAWWKLQPAADPWIFREILGNFWKTAPIIKTNRVNGPDFLSFKPDDLQSLTDPPRGGSCDFPRGTFAWFVVILSYVFVITPSKCRICDIKWWKTLDSSYWIWRKWPYFVIVDC